MNQQKPIAKRLLAFLPPILTGIISGLLISGTAEKLYSSLKKPPCSPPSFLFPIVWTMLYLFMGIATYYILFSVTFHNDKKMAFMVYSAQLLLNFLWPILFFRFRLYGFSVLILCLLWFLVFINTIIYYRIHKKAGYFMVPYLIWIAYALYLNISIAFLN